MSTLKIRPLNSELQLIAKMELNENPDQTQEYVDILKTWLEKSTHLRSRTDDQFLILFLRGCKYSLQRTKEKLDMYYTYRTHLTEIIGGRDPMLAKINEIIRIGVTLPLPITGSPGNPRVIFIRSASFDPSRIRIEDVTKVASMLYDVLMMEDDNSIVAGLIVVCDLANVTMAHILQMQPAIVKKVIMLFEESSPIRQKGVHYINAPKSFQRIFALLKSLLNEKMRNRLFMHSSLDELYSMVPRKMMPTEYEGEAGSLRTLADEWEKKLLSYRQYFMDESQKYGVDETKRIGPDGRNPLLGAHGSFKQLQVD